MIVKRAPAVAAGSETSSSYHRSQSINVLIGLAVGDVTAVLADNEFGIPTVIDIV